MLILPYFLAARSRQYATKQFVCGFCENIQLLCDHITINLNSAYSITFLFARHAIFKLITFISNDMWRFFFLFSQFLVYMGVMSITEQANRVCVIFNGTKLSLIYCRFSVAFT